MLIKSFEYYEGIYLREKARHDATIQGFELALKKAVKGLSFNKGNHQAKMRLASELKHLGDAIAEEMRYMDDLEKQWERIKTAFKGDRDETK